MIPSRILPKINLRPLNQIQFEDKSYKGEVDSLLKSSIYAKKTNNDKLNKFDLFQKYQYVPRMILESIIIFIVLTLNEEISPQKNRKYSKLKKVRNLGHTI